MHTPRAGHSATALPDGRVLVAGGNGVIDGQAEHFSSAELYDPATGMWSPTGSMSMSRHLHAAILLPDGRVLVAGSPDTFPTASTELYDPATGQWSLTGAMGEPRRSPRATLLRDGRVLVVGGTSSAGAPLDSAEIYDPSTGVWSPTGSMAEARHLHTATLLGDGRVLVTGGDSATAELYDPATGTWSSASSMSTARQSHRAILLPNGTVLVAGSTRPPSVPPEDSAEIYNPETDTWVPTDSLAAGRGGFTATLLPFGSVLVTGGWGDTPSMDSAELYSPTDWAPAGNMAEGRYLHTATLLHDGRVLVAGGNMSGTAETFNFSVLFPEDWLPTYPLNIARYGHTATPLLDGRVLVAGGSNQAGESLASGEVYDGGWTLTGNLAEGRVAHAATRLADGRVLVTGGGRVFLGGTMFLSGSFLSSAEVYDPVSGTWSMTGSMLSARAGHTSTLLPDGRVLVAGGDDDGDALATGQTESFLGTSEVYDPATGTWSPAGTMITGRTAHSATLLHSGKVLVNGGWAAHSNLGGFNTDVYGDTKNAELFDPATNTWSATGQMVGARIPTPAILLADGRVLVASGALASGSVAIASAELYNPATGTWASTGNMATSHQIARVAAALPDGRVLVAGGFMTVPPPSQRVSTTEAEIFEPIGGTWSMTSPMSAPRVAHTMTSMPDGSILAVGGFNIRRFLGPSSVLASAEIYFGAPAPPPPPPPPAPSLSIDDRTLVEGNAATMVFTVTLSNPHTTAITVDYATSDGSATAGPDYTAAAGTLTFAPGQTSRTITIAINNDIVSEAQETFFVNLGNAVGADIDDAQAVGTILNDDTVTVSIGDASVVEGNAGATVVLFTVALSAAAEQIVSVDFATGNATATAGSDYTAAAGTVVFNPGETTRTIPITVHGDTDFESDETFVVTLSNDFNVEIDDGQGIGTILNDDVPPSLSIGDVTVTEGDSGRMALARNTNTATLLTDGRVLVAGHSPAEVYNPATNRWTTTGALVHPRYVHTATRIMGGRVLVAGGWNDVVAFGEAEVYDPSTNSWSAAASMVEARWAHTATLLPGSRVLVAGGQRLISGGTQTLASTEVYDVSSDTWSASGGMATPRREHTATRLPDGRVLVTGGRNGGGTLASAEVFDPVTETWSPAGNMAAARSGHVVALLADGRVLVAGGYNNGGHLSSAELYNPVTGTWTTTGSMTAPRYWIGQSASVLSDGRVLVAGSSRNGGLASADLYDPSTGTWSATGTMAEGRGVYASAPLMDGRVLVAGGRNAISGRLRTAELYDPSTGTWDPAGGAIVTFTVTLSPASDQTVTVHFATADGTATAAGADYNGGSATVVFNPGVTSRGVSVRVNPDRDVEPDETFAANLTNASNAIIADGTGIGTIVNDDEPPVSLSIATPAGSDVVVDLPPLTLTFDSVTQAGQTHLTTSTTGPSSPAGFSLGDPPTYIDLSTSAGFTGSVEICIDYSSFSYTNETLLRLFHFDDPAWIDITSSLDTVANVICGNTTSFSPFAIFEPIESPGPVLALPANITAEATSAAGAFVDFTATASQEIDGPLPVDCVPPAGSMFSLGSTSVSCSAVDGTGSSTSGSFTVTVVDSTAPVLTLPADITRSTTNPAGTVVDFSASATDVVDGAVAVQCSPGSGSLFPIGVTTVLCTAADLRGLTANGSFTVTVLFATGNNTPPKVRGLVPRIAWGASPAGAVVKFEVWGQDTEDGRLPAACSHQSGAVFPIGLTIVTCTVTDSAGAVGTGAFAVIVIANLPPKLVGLVDHTVHTTSNEGKAVSFHVWGFDLEDGKLPAVCSPQSGDIFPIGQTVVSCTTTDSAGATATGSFTVKVHRRFFGHK
jgi:N-acetylneuraminic acid mutarotase